MRLHEFLDRAADRTPDAVAIIHEGERMTYRQLRDQTCQLAHRLMREPLERSARVATYMPNHPASFICQYGVHRTSLVWLPLNPKSSIEEVIDILRDFGAQWLFIHSDFVPHLERIRKHAPEIRGFVCVDAAVEGLPSLGEWIAPEPVALPENDIGPTDWVALRTTGGSTGKPKGVMRSSLSNALVIADYLMALPYTAPPVNLVLTPLSHAAGEVALPIFACGGTQVILASTSPRKILEAIQAHRVTTVFLPPTLVYTMLGEPSIADFDLSSLRYVLYGSAPMSVHRLREAWTIFGPVFAQVYGLSESTSTMSIMTPAEHAQALAHHPHRLASCGRGGPLYRIKVVQPDGRQAAPREMGEIVCSGAQLMNGYYENPQATAEAIKAGWLYSGDLGYMDEDGYVYIVDRKKDLIISGGFNVYPGEVEQVVFQHPAVKDCTVIGIPDDKWGEAVTAVVELKPGASLAPDEMVIYCKEKLGGVKAPKSVVVWPELPRSPAGKVLKKEVRAHFWKNTDRLI